MIVMSDTAFDRIERVLIYIHEHLDQALTVESLAEKNCWSRWQFQRVFNSYTGQNVAQYIRELRLSRAAEMLLSGPDKQLDIALACGFESEVSFSRSFKQVFACSPGQYRRRGQRTGLKTPIRALSQSSLALNAAELAVLPAELERRLLQIRVEARPEFQVLGIPGRIKGIFSEQPDFSSKVPALWQTLNNFLHINSRRPVNGIGVLDTSRSELEGNTIDYWACVQPELMNDLRVLEKGKIQEQELKGLTVPAQEYAVIPFSGPIQLLDKTLQWFIHYWLPSSGYRGLNSFDLEIYQSDFDPEQSDVEMEYWVPVAPDRVASIYQ